MRPTRMLPRSRHDDESWDGSVPPPRPLIVTADVELLDDVLRACALAGVEADVSAGVAEASARWAAAPVVLLGSDALGGATPARRPDVHVVHRGLDDAAVWRHAVQVGASDVITVPGDVETLSGILVDATAGTTHAPVVAFMSGRGGAGASSASCAVALGAVHRGLRPVLLDLDPVGGGLDLVLGAENIEGARWTDLESLEGRVAGETLVRALPHVHGVALVSADRTGRMLEPQAVETVMDAVTRVRDLCVLDLPTAWTHGLLEAVTRVTTLAVLVPADVRGCAATHARLDALRRLVPDVQVVVRTGPGRGLEADAVADAVGAPLLAVLHDDGKAPRAYEHGDAVSVRGRSPWAGVVGAVLDHVGVFPVGSP